MRGRFGRGNCRIVAAAFCRNQASVRLRSENVIGEGNLSATRASYLRDVFNPKRERAIARFGVDRAAIAASRKSFGVRSRSFAKPPGRESARLSRAFARRLRRENGDRVVFFRPRINRAARLSRFNESAVHDPASFSTHARNRAKTPRKSPIAYHPKLIFD